jgi:hypothetical protein
MLGPLLNNGGPTPTHALNPNSPAINSGSNLLSLATDQRGATYSRVVAGTADIGAFEVQTVAGPALPGDYNRDNVVDAGDYVVWRKTLNFQVQAFSGADGNGNGTIDAPDLAIWKQHFGTSAGAGLAQTPSQPVAPIMSAMLPPPPLTLVDSPALDSPSKPRTPLAPPVHAALPSRRHNSPRADGNPILSVTTHVVNHRAHDAALLAVLADRNRPPRSHSAIGTPLALASDQVATNVAAIDLSLDQFGRIRSKLRTAGCLRPENADR